MEALHTQNSAELGVNSYVSFLLLLLFFFFFWFLGPHLRHMEVPRLGVESELQPLAYTTATAMRDLSHVCDLCHSSRQRWILIPLSEVRDRTRSPHGCSSG